MKASKISNREGIQVSKDHDIELKEIIDNNDNPFNEETSCRCFGSNRNNKQKVNRKEGGSIPSWYNGAYPYIILTQQLANPSAQ